MDGTRHPTDWERQREQLSAYLDGELPPAERDALVRHTSNCPECIEELSRLGRVRVLLGALPAPAVPRSFALPVTSQLPSQRAVSPTPPRRPPAAATRPAWYGVSQWVGGIAASIGLFLLLGTALLGSGGVTPLGMSEPRNQAPAGAIQTTHTPMEVRTNPTASSGATSSGQSTTPAATPAATSTTPSTVSPAPTPVTSTLPVGPIAGAGLLAGGLALLLAGRFVRHGR